MGRSARTEGRETLAGARAGRLRQRRRHGRPESGALSQEAERDLGAEDLENGQRRKHRRVRRVNPVARLHLVGVHEDRRITGDPGHDAEQIVDSYKIAGRRTAAFDATDRNAVTGVGAPS